jgi:hypothetical protein
MAARITIHYIFRNVFALGAYACLSVGLVVAVTFQWVIGVAIHIIS